MAISGIENVIAIAASDYFTIVLKSDGTILAWGENSDWQLGLGDDEGRFSPVFIREFKALTLLNTLGVYAIPAIIMYLLN